jgi:3-hydroxyacyl-CoA dehydrogenase / enoyl-CoA hydratase / 3-hydroxybutyryl-CoA epimerase
MATAPALAPNWSLTTDADGVAWLMLDKAEASANSLSRAVMEELNSHLEAVERQKPRALVITSAKSGFVAGADIKEFVGIQAPEQAFAMIREGQQVF